MVQIPATASVGDLLEYLGPGLLTGRKCPCWPPDVFALTATVLRRSGAYVRVLDLLPKKEGDLLGSRWPEHARKMAAVWRDALNAGLRNWQESPEAPLDVPVPGQIDSAWVVVLRHAKRPLADVLQQNALCRALLLLCLVADEASSGIGIETDDQDRFLEYAALQVLPENDLASVCLRIDPERVRVLPKQHTSQRGITVRSLSHNLALCPASEVEVLWNTPYALLSERKLDVLNLLLLPWPLEVSPKDFAICSPESLPNPAEPYRFFSFRLQSEGKKTTALVRYLRSALERAQEHVERVDCIVFPELALTSQEYMAAERLAVQNDALLIAGVNGQPGDQWFSAATNACFVQPFGLTGIPKTSHDFIDRMRIRQSKHHRWCLDRNQIIQYGLGGVLPASKSCWELSEVGHRFLHFVTLGPWLTLSVLICEDLARQDPVSEILRAVGPNLVIALLMDGPQLRSRWPSRYASVLADDPGSSVLTITSLGMAGRSRPSSLAEPDRSRTIALWRDVRYGEREIELPKDHNACVVSPGMRDDRRILGRRSR